MPNMILGGLTFNRNPTKMTMIIPDKHCAYEKTYSSVAFFSWGTSIVGKELELEWTNMRSSDFDSLDTMFRADAEVNFNPQAGTGKTYTVNIVSLDGAYQRILGSAVGVWRSDVKMILLVMAEV